MSRALIAATLIFSSGCASGLKAVERGQWVLVTAEDGKSQELITQESYDEEVVTGRERKVKFGVEDKAPVLHDADAKLTATAGEVMRFRVNEGGDVEVLSDNAVAEVFWTEHHRVDGWNGDQAVEGFESEVYVRALKPGKGKLKLVDKTWGVHEYELTVTPKK